MSRRILIIGAGIGGLTAGALLAQAGYPVNVLEAHTYPGGCAGTFYHQGYRFEAGATVAGGFHPNGPHTIIGKLLDTKWHVQRHDPAWMVHLPGQTLALNQTYDDVLANFPQSESFWQAQRRVADLGWKMAAQGLPWPPTDLTEWAQVMKVGLANFPADLRLLPFVFSTVEDWMKRSGIQDAAFKRFLDGQLLISAQTTAEHVNALWGATALDLARQGVYHVAGGIGGLAETLATKLEALGGEILYRQRVTRIAVEQGRVTGVYAQRGRHGSQKAFFPADFVIANTTPWSLDQLLQANSPLKLRKEVVTRKPGWGAFVLHLGVDASKLPPDLPHHHQIIDQMDGPLGETHSLFLSMSPEWDERRAPAGHRAVTVTTHTRVQPWWDLIERDEQAYHARKAHYTEKLLTNIENAIPGFRNSIDLLLPGTPVTYQFYTQRSMGMVGGFPITSLFNARGPRTGLPNLRLVGDSIFPGQSTAGVSLGALRVARDVQRHLRLPATRSVHRSAVQKEPLSS
ncbi:MAG: NAD(P)/FAD-dependent oxidoreductase [Anaerolineae bacterium]|nr:NAD(P)/FAD-dependent oxidoreductase [Anaerolineae bacterium]